MTDSTGEVVDGEVVVEARISAPPEVVFDYFVDPDKLRRWLGEPDRLTPEPEGRFGVAIDGQHLALGRYLAIDRPTHVSFTWGWEGSEAVPPGSSTVEVMLEELGSETKVRIIHRGLPSGDRDHLAGWLRFIPILSDVAGTGPINTGPINTGPTSTGPAGTEPASTGPVTIEEVTVVGSQGHRLSARLHRPTGRAKGSILLAHCFTCSKDLHTMTRLAGGLSEAGFAVLRFDFTGLGESAGDFASTSVSANLADLTRAATTLIERGFGPCGLIGHSLGGAAAVLAASKLKTVRSLVTVGAPASTQHVTHLFADQVDELVTAGRATVTIGGRSFELDAGFVDDLDRHDVLEHARSLGRPYLVVHARDDDIVPFENAELLHQAATEPKRLAALDTGGHLFTDRAAAESMLGQILDWFNTTL